ncbi:YkgJ family cysteine cluster protein [Candidatus Woesearchaeota archaeon]|nr:YkgJ family cysteine cluster protein [Candidatus Woesearchaeota archaeon]
MKPFVCHSSGNCCTNLKAANGFGLMLFDDEVKLFRDKGMQILGREPRLEFRSLPDPKTKSRVILLSQLGESRCPFLAKDASCQIYEERPLVCRGYPVQSTGLDPARPGRFAAGRACEGCAKSDVFELIDKKMMAEATINQRARKMFEMFGDSYVFQWMVERNNYQDAIIVQDLRKEGHFAAVDPKESSSWPEVSFEQFLQSINRPRRILESDDLASVKEELIQRLR